MTFYKWGYYSLEKSSNDSRWEFLLEKSFIDSRLTDIVTLSNYRQKFKDCSDEYIQAIELELLKADCFDLPDLTE